MRSPLMDELSDLDPARHVHAPGTARDDALQQILGADRNLPLRPRRRPGVAVGTAAVAVTALAVGVTWASTLGAPAAYASWTAAPTVVDAATAQTAACPTAVPGPLPDDGGTDIPEIAVEPVVVEVRGDYTYVVQVGDDVVADCFVSTAQGDPLVYTSSAVGGGDVEVAATDLVVLAGGVASWSLGGSSEGAVTSAYGRAGADVRGVTVALADGRVVEASVENGWWALWAPGGEGFGSQATVTYDDGTTAPVDLALPTS